MRLPITGWKNTLKTLGYKVVKRPVGKVRRKQAEHQQVYGPLEPRQMLATSVSALEGIETSLSIGLTHDALGQDYSVEFNRGDGSDSFAVTDFTSTQSAGSTTVTLDSLGVTFADDGQFTATATLFDGTTAVDTQEFNATVADVAPNVRISADQNFATLDGDFRINFDVFDPGDDEIVSWIVNWGDDTSGSYAGSTRSATHRYQSPGSFPVTVTATDSDGAVVTQSLALDSSFGDGGVVVTDFFGGDDQAVDSVVQPDGKVIVAGTVETADYINRGYVLPGGQNLRFDGESNVVTTSPRVALEGTDYYQITSGQTYRISATAWSGDGAGGNVNPAAVSYLGFNSYDSDYKRISPFHIFKSAGATDTRLAVDLEPGQTQIILDDATGWYNEGREYQRTLAWYGYANSSGRVYDDYTYTRNYRRNLWDEGAVNGNVITLRDPWNGPKIKAGTAVRNTTVGRSYNYALALGEVIPAQETQYESVISDNDTDYSRNSIRPGTAYIRPLALANWNRVSGNQLNFGDFRIDPIVEVDDGADFLFDENRTLSTTATGTITSSNFYPVDPKLSYKISVEAFSGDGSGGEVNASTKHFLGFAAYDIDKKFIRPQMYLKSPGAVDTRLAVDLVDGATQIVLEDATGWYDAGSSHQRTIAWYGYENSLGEVYDDFTYTRNYRQNLWDAGDINGNVITLNKPWDGGGVPAGTAVRNTRSAGTYNYALAINQVVPESPTQYQAIIGGDRSELAYTGFRFGTAFVRALALSNWPLSSGNRLNVSNFRIDPIVEAKARDIGLVRYNVDGSRDASFGVDGLVSTNIRDNLSANDYGSTITLQPDGKILVAGRTAFPGQSNNFTVTRYHESGGVDTSFGVMGTVNLDIDSGASDIATSIFYHRDENGVGDKILVSGYSIRGGSPNEYNFAVAKLNVDGSPDLSFGTGGTTAIDLGSSLDLAYDVVVQSDGSVVVGGRTRVGGRDQFAVLRLTPDGQPDLSFGEDGTGQIIRTLSPNRSNGLSSILLRADDGFFVTGYGYKVGASNDFAVLSFTADGQTDTSYGTEGIATVNFSGSDVGQKAELLADGKIIITGYAIGYISGNVTRTIGAARLNADGSVDETFGNSGTSIIRFDHIDEFSADIKSTPDGGFVVTGYDRVGTDRDFKVAKFLPDNRALVSPFGFTETGGSLVGKGSIEAPRNFEGDVVLREGDSFKTETFKQVTIAAGTQQLLLEFSDLNFDRPGPSNADQINDSFEIALLDDAGLSVVPTIGVGRDSFFNLSEESNQAVLAPGATYLNGVVSVDVSMLADASTADVNVNVVFRLVNNDSDTQTSVRIRTVDSAYALWGTDDDSGSLVRFNNYSNAPDSLPVASEDVGYKDFGPIYYQNAADERVKLPKYEDGTEIESFTITGGGKAFFVVNVKANKIAPGETNIEYFPGTILASKPTLFTIDLNEVESDPDGWTAKPLGQFNIDGAITGLALDPSVDGKIFAINQRGGTDHLYRIDVLPETPGVSNLSVTNVSGTDGVRGQIDGVNYALQTGEDLVFHSSGKLFISEDKGTENIPAGSGSDKLFEVSPDTGQIISIADSDLGSIFTDSVKIEGLAFDPLSGDLIASETSRTSSASLFRIKFDANGNPISSGDDGIADKEKLFDVFGGVFNLTDIEGLSFLTVQAGGQPLGEIDLNDQPADFSGLVDVTDGFSIEYGNTSFAEQPDKLYSRLTATNLGVYDDLQDSLVLVVSNISISSVQLLNSGLVTPAGFTVAGEPYFNLSDLAIGPDGKYLSGSSKDIQLVFDNPDGFQFDYDVRLFSQRAVQARASISGQTVPESAGQTTAFTIALDAPADHDVVVEYRIDSAASTSTAIIGNDYSAALTGTVTIPAGELSAPVLITVVDDNLVELDEDLSASITGVTSASNVIVDSAGDTALATIIDDDSSEITLSAVPTVEESAGAAGFTVSLSRPVDTDVSIVVLTVAGTATDGEDYVGATGGQSFSVSIPAGQLSSSGTVTIIDDIIDEIDETYRLQISSFAATGRAVSVANNQSETTILDDDLPPAKPILDENQRLVTTDDHPAANGQVTEFIVPQNPGAIRIGFSDLIFDRTSNQTDARSAPDINDAFEIALLDASGAPVTSTIPLSNAVFNLTGGQSGIWATGVEVLDVDLNPVGPGAIPPAGFVQIDIGNLAAGTTIQLVARLVNNDADDTTTVTVDFATADVNQGLHVMQTGGQAVIEPFSTNRINRTIDFEKLSDVSATFDWNYAHTLSSDNRLSVGIDITKTGQIQVREQLILVLSNFRQQDPANGPAAANVSATRFDGTLPWQIEGIPAGSPYIRLSSLLAKDFKHFFVNQAQIEDLLLEFLADTNNQRFDFDLHFLGQSNQSPSFTSDPYAANQGHAYPVEHVAVTSQPEQYLELVADGTNQLRYPVTTADPERDAVVVSILSGPTGPTGLALDEDGNLVWTPQSGTSDVGIHSIRLRATDEFGAFDPANDQVFTLRVTDSAINGPPAFDTSPVRTAQPGTLYQYDSNAFDPDGDDVEYSGTLGAKPRTYRVPVGGNPALLGPMTYLTLINDHDQFVGDAYGNSTFSAIRIYESGQRESSTVIDFDPSRFTDYTGLQDGAGESFSSVRVVGDGTVVQLRGNVWQAYLLESPYTVTANTILEFTFAANKEAEIHGIGLDDNDGSVTMPDQKWYQLFGTQAAQTNAVQDYNVNERYSPSWSSPSDFFVDPETGEVTWTPPNEAAGKWVDVQLQATDPAGLFDTQEYQIRVSQDLAPEIGDVDLTPSNIDVSGLYVHEQELSINGVVSVDVTNLGSDIATEPFDVLFFEDRDFDGLYNPVHDVILGSAEVDQAVAANDTINVRAELNGSVQFAGAFIWAFVDSRRVVDEIREDNNYVRSEHECRVVSGGINQFEPVLKYFAAGENPDIAALNTPIVIDLDYDGLPEILFDDGTGIPLVHVINGEDGSPHYDSGYTIDILAEEGFAVADIDNDNTLELVSMWRDSESYKLYVYHFDSDGQIYTAPNSAIPPAIYSTQDQLIGNVSFANVDGDPQTEIVIGNAVFDFESETNQITRKEIQFRNTNGEQIVPQYGESVTIANFDGDLAGTQEILSGNTLYTTANNGVDGSNFLWRANIPTTSRVTNAVADFNNDGIPEIIINDTTHVYILDAATGSEIKRIATGLSVNVDTTGTGGDSPVTIADFDNDGLPEISVTSNTLFEIIDIDLLATDQKSWHYPIVENTSGYTGSTAFDFDGDGTVEIIYADEETVYAFSILDSTQSGLLTVRGTPSIIRESGTGTELPVVADVDGDGKAEFITVANPNLAVDRPETYGIVVYEDRQDDWVYAPPVWNQESYHINNIDVDPDSPTYLQVPAVETPSWLDHNSYRTQGSFEGVASRPAPDLIPSYARTVEAADGSSTTYTIRVGNGGEVAALLDFDNQTGRPIPDRFVVELFDGEPSATNPSVGSATVYRSSDNEGDIVAGELQPGQFIDVQITVAGPAIALEDQYFFIDSHDDPEDDIDGQIEECHENNNIYNPVVGIDPNNDPFFVSDPPQVSVTDPTGQPLLDRNAIPVTRITAIEGQQWSYDVDAVDPDNAPVLDPATNELVAPEELDVLVYELAVAPNGMKIDSTTGVITWTPGADDPGDFVPVRVRVSDGKGGTASQAFTITVLGIPAPPQIVSTPPSDDLTVNSVAHTDRPWIYRVRATDPNGDRVTFSLQGDIAGLTLDQPEDQDWATLRWDNPSPQGGTKSFTIIASDPGHLTDRQDVTIEVRGDLGDGDGLGDTLPDFVSQPVRAVPLGSAYRYDAFAIDPDGDPTYSLNTLGRAELSGMMIDADTGTILWDTGASTAQVGDTFTIAVTATQGPGSVTQTYNLAVGNPLDDSNFAPDILPATLRAPANQLFTFNVTARDLDNDYPLSFSLIDEQGRERSAIADLTITPAGLLTYSAGAAGTSSSFMIRVRDNDGAIDTEDFTINVVADAPPTIDLQFVGETADSPSYFADEIVTIDTNVFDDFGIERDGIKVTLHHDTLFRIPGDPDFADRTFIDLEVSNEGIADWGGFSLETLTQAEVVTVKGSATDTAGQTTIAADVHFTVEPVDLTKPRVSILNPAPGQKATENLEVKATIFDGDDNLTSYTLVLITPGGDELTLVTQLPADGQTTLVGYDITEGVNNVRTLAQLDPGQYENGLYTLRLTAIDADGQMDESTSQFIMDGKFDLADFEISFEDLRIPVRGFPIVVTRTYDSGDAEDVGDFGNGWNLDFSDVKIDITYPKDTHYEFGLPIFQDGVRIEVTYGDDRTEGFTFYGQAVNSSRPFGLPIDNYFYPRFQPDAGVRTNLIVNDIVLQKSFNGRSYFAIDAQRSARSQSGYYNPTDPTFAEQFQLKRRDGTSMFFNANSGQLSRIETSTGEALTFSASGIRSSEGRNVDFIRDEEDRIINIIDPDGRVLSYGYENGNLTSFTNRNGTATGNSAEEIEKHTTRFEYNAPRAHYLTDIIDPLGRKSVRTFYDDSGRVDYIIDADNKVLDYLYELPDGDLVPDLADDAAAIVATLEQLDGGQAIYSVVHSDRSRNIVRSETTLVDDVTFTLDDNGVLTGEPGLNLSNINPAEDTEITITQYNEDDQPIRSVTVVGLVDGETDSAGVTNTETDDLVTTNQYDPNHGQIKVATDIRGNQTRYEYGVATSALDRSADRLHSTFDQFNNYTYTPYSSLTGHQLAVVTRDSAARFNYNKSPDVQWIDLNGVERAIRNRYNEYGDVIATSDQFNNLTRFEYDANGNPSAVTRDVRVYPEHDNSAAVVLHQFRTETDYDLEDRVIATRQLKREGTGDWILLSSSDSGNQNGLGQIISGTSTGIYSAGQNPTSASVYDLRGQTIETTRTAFGSDGVERVFSSRSTYDAKGRVVYSTDEFLLPRFDNDGTELAPGTADADIYGSRSFYDAQGRVVKSQRLKGVVIDINIDTERSSLSTTAPTPTVISWSQTNYDNAGRVTSSTSWNTASTDPETGLTTTYFYNAFGETTKTVAESWNAAGNGKVTMTTLSVYNDNGQVTFSQDAYLDGSGRPTFGTETKYDGRGRSQQSIRFENPVVEFNESTGQTALVRRGDQLFATKTIYGEFGLVYQSVAADGQITTYEYDEYQRRTATIGHATEVRVETATEGVYEVRTVQHRTETIYDQTGRVAAERSNIIHNGFGHNMHDDSNVQETRFHYDENGNVVRTEFEDGSYAEVRYDQLGRKVAESQQTAPGRELDWDDSRQTFYHPAIPGQFGGPGTPEKVVPTRLSSYDSQGRLATVTLPDPDPTDGDDQRPVYRYGYDFRGQQVSIIDPLDRETNLVYDELGRQIARQLPLHSATTPFEEISQYDFRGRQNLSISFEGVHMVPVYDEITGRMIETYYYQNAANYGTGGNLPDELIDYTYDDYGRQIRTARNIVNGPRAGTSRVEAMTYDDRQQLESVTNSEGTIRYSYDNLGRQTEVAFSGNGSVDNEPAYNAATFDPDNTTIYAYDELGRLKSVTAVERNNEPVVDVNTATTANGTGDQSDQTRYIYDLNGSMAATIYANGITHSYQYDDLNRLEKLIHFRDTNMDGVQDSNEISMAEFDYELRADGKRIAANEKYYEDGGGQFAPASQIVSYTWEYDDANRLISETASASALSFDPTQTVDPFTDYTIQWTYDLNGNRTQQHKTYAEGNQSGETTVYVYDANDRLEVETLTVDSTVTETRYGYTRYGYDQTQQTSKTVRVAGDVTRSQSFTYDLQGRMASVTTTNLTADGVTEPVVTVTEYEYDRSGNRVKTIVRVDADADGTYESTTTTEYLTDSRNHTGYSQVLQETTTDETGNVKMIVYTIGHDQINQTVYEGVDTNGDGDKDGWAARETHFFGTDGHGSVRVLYDLAAKIANLAEKIENDAENDVENNILQVFHFDAYGNLLNFAEGATPLTSYLYSGEAFDFNINQQYLRARWYDAQNGRFNRLDPFFGNLSDPQSLHKYAYVHGDPVNGIDPSGRVTLVGIAKVSAGIGGLAGFSHGAILGYRDGGFSGALQRGLFEGAVGAFLGFGGGYLLGLGGISLAGFLTIAPSTGILLLGTMAGGLGAGFSIREFQGANDGYERAAAVSNFFFSLVIFGAGIRGLYGRANFGTRARSPIEPPAPGEAEIHDPTFIDAFADAIRTNLRAEALPGDESPHTLAQVVNRDGLTGWGTSTAGRVYPRQLHPAVEASLNGVPQNRCSPFHRECAEPEALSELLYNIETAYRVRLTSPAQAKPYTQGAKIQIRAIESGDSQSPCGSSCRIMLRDFGVTHRSPR